MNTNRLRISNLLDIRNPTDTLGNMFTADFLVKNGVYALPVPIGKTVYEIRARGKRQTIKGWRRCDYSITTNMIFKNAIECGYELYVKEKSFVKYDKTRWNKTVFLTKEEAEEKLKEKENASSN